MSPALAAWLVWADAVASTSVWAVLRASSAPPRGTFAGSVVLVRPCAGAHEHLERALASTSALVGTPKLSVVLAVRDAADRAAPVARRAHVELARAGLDVRLVWTGAPGPNRKIGQLAAALAVAPQADAIVIADADVELDRATVDDLLATLAAGAGASWAAPVEPRPASLADRASAAVLDSSLHAFPLLAALDARGMVGKLVAVRRTALERAGGLAPLAEFLGEDLELARRLHARGFRVVRARAMARSIVSHRTMSAVFARYARWLAVVRAQRPALLLAYPLLLASAPLLLASALALRAPLAAAIVVAARTALAAAARVRTGAPIRWPTLPVAALAADVLLLAAFARALASTRVVWEGVALRVRGGRIAPQRERSGDRGEQRLGDAHP